MKIYVINLKRSTDRRRVMEEQFTRLGISVDFFEAVDGSALNSKWIKMARSQLYSQLRGYLGFVSKNEIACFASHYSLWEECVRLNEAIVVLEDDIEVSDNLLTRLADLRKLLKRLHYIRLMAKEKDAGHIKITDDIYLYPHYPCGTQGYVIDPYAAGKLLACAAKWAEPVDCYLDRWYIHGFRPYCINPELVSHSEIDSTIGSRVNTKSRGIIKLLQEIYRPFLKFEIFIRKAIINYTNPVAKKSELN